MQRLVFILLAFVFQNASAQYILDSTRRMSPGAKYFQYKTTSPARKIFVLEVNLGEPTVELQVVKSGNRIDGNAETVSAMFDEHDTFVYHDVSGAVNADFFTIHHLFKNPTNVLVNDGEIMWSFPNPRSVFGITANRIPFITNISESHAVTKPGGSALTIDSINRPREANQLVMYNRFIGTSTGTTGGTEVKIVPVDGKTAWLANASISCKVLAVQTSGNMSFTDGEAVLSGDGTAASYLSTLNVNDIVTLKLNVSASPANITQLTGGRVKLVNNGMDYSATSVPVEGDALGTTRQPRTAVGYTSDSSKVYMVVVDGRSTASEGMTFSELAGFMIYLGCSQALNLDGGGSSTLVASGMLKNKPSDGTERPVSNALLAFTNTKTLDDFETGVGHFNRAPTYSSYTVGISSASTASVSATNVHSGYKSLKIEMKDNTSSSSNWKVRLLSGSGNPSNNRQFKEGTISVWFKTSTANTGAKVKIWVNDIDGIEISPALDIISDGNWHKYVWSITNFGGTTYDTGNGEIDTTRAYLNSIEFIQPNTSTTWVIYMDDLMHDRNASGSPFSARTTATKVSILEQPSEKNGFRAYPNPNNGNFVVEFNDGDADEFNVIICDVTGKKVMQQLCYGQRENFDISRLQNGIYC
jgi:hypothetical protein